MTQIEKFNMSKNEIKIRDYKVANYQKWLLEEAAKIQTQRQRQKIVTKQEINMMSAHKGDLTISRFLGHKSSIPGSAQWRFNKNLDTSSCWNCGNWIFALVLWNEEIGILNANNNINIESEEKKRVIDHIREHDQCYMSNSSVPMLFSNATNWKGEPFVKLRDFIQNSLACPDFSHQASEMAKEKLEITNFKLLSPRKQEELRNLSAQIEADLKEQHLKENVQSFGRESIHKFIRYRNTMFINLEKVKDPENTFILPIFIKPGRTHFMLRTPLDSKIKSRVESNQRVRILTYQTAKDVQFRFYYNRHIVPFREEKIPACKYSTRFTSALIDSLRDRFPLLEAIQARP